ncbi:MAG: SDR family NAD(P)-dependent oxidoreductase [Archangium sp.]|nr:SDR family NAD(P)-dependent oxidoreductase [Archangium sp.]
MKVLITGATNGMGKGVARALATHPNVELVLLGRSQPLLAQTSDELARLSTPARISTIRCDLSRLREVREAISEFRSRHTTLDAIFINAGIGYAPRHDVTEDRLDAHFQVNYLSQFMLTLNLLDLLEGSQHGGRVVFNTPSFGELKFDDLQLEKEWNYELALGQGMAAKRLFFTRLHELYERRAPRVSCFGFEIPKTVWTNQINLIPFAMRAAATVMKAFGQFISIDACGQLMAPLFLEGQAESAERSGHLITHANGMLCPHPKPPTVLDAAQRERLWKVSLDLCADEATTRAAGRLTRP